MTEGGCISWSLSRPLTGLTMHSQYIYTHIYVCIYMCVCVYISLSNVFSELLCVCRETNNSKATLDLKTPISTQCTSNLVRWKFQTVKWCKLKWDIKQRISYVKRFHVLEMTVHNPLSYLWYISRKSSHKGILRRTLLLLRTFSDKYKKLITWLDISNTKWYYTYHSKHTWKKQ